MNGKKHVSLFILSQPIVSSSDYLRLLLIVTEIERQTMKAIPSYLVIIGKIMITIVFKAMKK